MWSYIALYFGVSLQCLSPPLGAAFTSPHIYFQCVNVSFNTDLRMLLKVEFGEREAGKKRGSDRFSDAREEVSVLFYWL